MAVRGVLVHPVLLKTGRRAGLGVRLEYHLCARLGRCYAAERGVVEENSWRRGTKVEAIKLILEETLPMVVATWLQKLHG